MVESNLVKLETGHTGILPTTYGQCSLLTQSVRHYWSNFLTDLSRDLCAELLNLNREIMVS